MGLLIRAGVPFIFFGIGRLVKKLDRDQFSDPLQSCRLLYKGAKVWNLENGLQSMVDQMGIKLSAYRNCEINLNCDIKQISLSNNGKIQLESDTKLYEKDHLFSAFSPMSLSKLLNPTGGVFSAHPKTDGVWKQLIRLSSNIARNESKKVVTDQIIFPNLISITYSL